MAILDYTGQFHLPFSFDGSEAAGTFDTRGVCQIVDGPSQNVYSGAASSLTNQFSRYRLRIRVLKNTAGNVTAKPVYIASVGGAYASDITTDDAMPISLGSETYIYGTLNIASSGTEFAAVRFVTGAVGDFAAQIEYRPYAIPGWSKLTLTTAGALTELEPGITNTAVGRRSSYSNEIKMAKIDIHLALEAAGIDPDQVVSDGIAEIASFTGYPAGTHNVPELLLPASYRALFHIYRSFAPDETGINGYKMKMYAELYEQSFRSALESLPLAVDGDWKVTPAEENYGAPSEIVR